MTEKGLKKVFKNREFLKLWIGQIVSNIGDEFAFIGLAALIVFQWNANAVEVSILFICAVLPSLVIGPFAGVFVDRWKRKITMMLMDIIRAFIVFLIIFSTQLWEIYILVFLLSSFSRFFYPAQNAIIPNIVKDENLVEANSISQMSYMLSLILGPALAAPLIVIFGYSIAFVFDSLSFLFSAFMISLIVIRENTERKKKDVIKEMMDGLSYIRNNRTVMALILLFSGIMFIVGGLNVGYTIYVRDVLHMKIIGLGSLEIAFGIGAIVGSVAVGMLAKKVKEGDMIMGGITFVGVLLFIMALTPHFFVIIFISILIGSANMFISNPANATLQRAVPDDFRGKVFGVQGAIIQGASLISMGLVGFLIAVFGIINLLIFVGIFVTIIGIILWVNRKFVDLISIA